MRAYLLGTAALAVAGIALLASAPANATVIDFETLPVGVLAGPVVADGTGVTFSVGAGAVGGGGPTYVADVGGTTTAFAPNDTPDGGVGGTRFLTDEPAGPSGAGVFNYFMTFSRTVRDLSLVLYDYRVDGGPSAGDTATLTVFSDASWTTAIGTDIFTIPTTNPADGNAELLSVFTNGIRSASITFSTADVGTGIDDIKFEVPEPGTMTIFGVALAGLGLVRRRRAA